MNYITTRVLAISTALVLSTHLNARENSSKWYFTADAGTSSSFLWAGNMYGGLSFVTTAYASYPTDNGFSLFAGAVTYNDFNSGLYLHGSDRNGNSCLEYYLGFKWSNLSIYFDDLVNGFHFNSKDSHYFGIDVCWTSDWHYPLCVDWYTVYANPNEYNSNGNRAFSTLVTTSYLIDIAKNLQLGPEVAIVPWDSPFCGYKSFSVCQLGAVGIFSIPVSDRFSVPIKLNAGWNPATGKDYWCASIRLSFE